MKQREDRGAGYEEAIADALANGPRKGRELKTAVMAELDVSHATVKRAAQRMVDRGELAYTGSGKAPMWELADSAHHSAPSHSAHEPNDDEPNDGLVEPGWGA